MCQQWVAGEEEEEPCSDDAEGLHTKSTTPKVSPTPPLQPPSPRPVLRLNPGPLPAQARLAQSSEPILFPKLRI